MPPKQMQPIGDPNDPHGMVAMMKPFFEWMRIRNYSEATVANRHTYLRYFINWAAARGVTYPTEVTRSMVERYQRFLYHYRKHNGNPLTFQSQSSRITAIRMWFKWMARSGHILYNPAADLDMPRSELRLPKCVLTPSEAEQVINQPNIGKRLGIRDRAILETLYSTGIRRRELVNLRPVDLDVERGTLVIWQGKGHKDRMIPIGDRAVAWVERYEIEVRPGLMVGDGARDALFLTHLGRPFTPQQMSDLVSGYVTAAEIGKQGSCHLFRHTMATAMLENGADIRYIQEMLGHSSLETTQIYARVSIRKLKEVHTKTHPARKTRPQQG